MKNNHSRENTQQIRRLDRLVNRYLAPLMFIGGVLVILFATLMWFDFRFRPLSVGRYFGGFLLFPSSYLDFPANIILFMPFGFGLTSLLDQARLSKRATFLSVLLAGFLLTWLVESLQYYLPGRTPNVSDIVSNTLGTLVGLACYRVWQDRTNFWLTVSKPHYLLLSLAVYLLLMSSLGTLIRERARLDNWPLNFPLMIGNERTANRSWQGSVSELAVFDRVLPKADIEASLNSLSLNGGLHSSAGESLVAYYPLQDPIALADHTGNNPDLLWKGGGEARSEDGMLQFDDRRWLISQWGVRYLAERLAASSQFTLMSSVATADFEQEGPARIISISAGPFYRNLTLGQEGQSLIVRVRTLQAGLNGTLPELKIPNFFVDQEPHIVVVTYDGLVLSVYVDDTETVHKLNLIPGAAFFSLFYGPFVRTVTMSTTLIAAQMILFYLLLFIPVGIILKLAVTRVRGRLLQIFLFLVGIWLPALLLEAALTARIGYELRPANVFLASAVIAVTYALLTPAARKHLRSL